MALRKRTQASGRIDSALATFSKWQRRVRRLRRLAVLLSLGISAYQLAQRTGVIKRGDSGSGGSAGSPAPRPSGGTPPSPLSAARSASGTIDTPVHLSRATTVETIERTVTVDAEGATIVEIDTIVETDEFDGSDGSDGSDEAADSPGATWVPGDADPVPEGFGIKVNERSGIYHQPGSAAYERTNPDRWYRSPEDAEADGFRAPKTA